MYMPYVHNTRSTIEVTIMRKHQTNIFDASKTKSNRSLLNKSLEALIGARKTKYKLRQTRQSNKLWNYQPHNMYQTPY